MIDRSGPFVGSIVSGVLYFTGTLCLFISSIGWEEMVFPAFVLFAVGGKIFISLIREGEGGGESLQESLVTFLNGICGISPKAQGF